MQDEGTTQPSAFTEGLYASFVPPGNAVHDEQAKPGALDLGSGRVLDPVETSKDPLQFLIGDANTVVLYPDEETMLLIDVELHSNPNLGARVFHRIVEIGRAHV